MDPKVDTYCIINFLPDDIRWLPLCWILKCYGHTANLAKLKPRAVVVQHVQAVILFARFVDILTLTIIIKMEDKIQTINLNPVLKTIMHKHTSTSNGGSYHWSFPRLMMDAMPPLLSSLLCLPSHFSWKCSGWMWRPGARSSGRQQRAHSWTWHWWSAAVVLVTGQTLLHWLSFHAHQQSSALIVFLRYNRLATTMIFVT